MAFREEQLYLFGLFMEDYNNVVGLPVAALWQYLNSGKEENDATL